MTHKMYTDDATVTATVLSCTSDTTTDDNTDDAKDAARGCRMIAFQDNPLVVVVVTIQEALEKSLYFGVHLKQVTIINYSEYSC